MKNTRSYPTVLGTMSFVEENGEIIACDLGDLSFGEETPVLRKAHTQMLEYMAGKRKVFDLPLNLIGTPFQKDVWNALLTVPWGTTASYKEIAIRSGHPTAFRAVGSAVGKNKHMIIVPCHRIIANDGSIGGFYGGVDLKRKILALEK